MAPEPPAPPEARPASADAKAPAKVPAKEPKAATGSAKRAGGEAFNYTIHVESFQSPRKAQERVQILKKAGLDAFSREVTVPGKGPYHRIFVGRYADRAQALASAEGLRGKHGIPAGARVVAASQMDR
jgi:cell division septation protein DedD